MVHVECTTCLWLLASVSRLECPVEIAQPDVEFCAQLPAGAEIARPATTREHSDSLDCSWQPSFKEHQRVQRVAVYDCVEGWTAGGQYDAGHCGLPVRYAAGSASERVHGCVVIGTCLGECQLDAAARVGPVAVYSAPGLAPPRRIPLPVPVDQVMDLFAGDGSTSLNLSSQPSSLRRSASRALSSTHGRMFGYRGSQRSTRLRA